MSVSSISAREAEWVFQVGGGDVPKPLSRERLVEELDAWVLEAQAAENREEAKRRILECFDNKSD